MTELSRLFEGHWLSRIDEYRHTPRAYFGIGAVNKVGEVAREIAKNSHCLIITDKTLRKLGSTLRTGMARDVGTRRKGNFKYE